MRFPCSLFGALALGALALGAFTAGPGVGTGRRRVARVDMGIQDSGPQQVTWDGRDERGQVLAPGLYLLSVALDTESTQSPQLRPLGIAY